MGMFQHETIVARTEHYTVTVCTPSGMVIVAGRNGCKARRYLGCSPYDAVVNWLYDNTYYFPRKDEARYILQLAEPVEHLQWLDEETE